MHVLQHLNENIQIIDGKVYACGEEFVRQVVNASPIPLPEDYLVLLRNISGTKNSKENFGLEFGVKLDGVVLSFVIFSAQRALEIQTEYQKVYTHPVSSKILDQIWLIGSDLGDLMYFYGAGKEGFGVYVAEDSALDFEYADKIADTLIDFLVYGKGLRTAFWMN